MYRFKTFHSGDCNGDFQLLEATINAWIETDHPRIRLMSQTPIGNQILFSFVFEIISEVDDQPAIAIAAVPEIFQDRLEDTPLDPNDPPPISGDPQKAK
ncbi:MAG TPA: hypothetical protein VH599_07625 [Ktedonobacterales bacterium]